MARVICLDLGNKRIGVAVGDTLTGMAFPYTTLYTSQTVEQTCEQVAKCIQESGAEEVIIGLPISLDGQVHQQGEIVLTFTKRLQEYISLPITFHDERFSTITAENIRNQVERPDRPKQYIHKQKGKKKKQGIDALAASIILEDFFRTKSSHEGLP